MTQPVGASDSGKLPIIKTAGLRHLTGANKKGEIQEAQFLLMSDGQIKNLKKVISGDPNFTPKEKQALYKALDMQKRLHELVTESTDLVNKTRFQKTNDLKLTPAQQEKFNEVIKEILRDIPDYNLQMDKTKLLKY